MKKVIDNMVQVLRNGGLVLYPTDTVWGIGCDPNNEEAVKRLNELKGRTADKSLIVVYSKDYVLENYIPEIPEVGYDLIDSATKPLTLILPNAKGVAKTVTGSDGSLGLRKVSEPEFLVRVLDKLRSGIVSTSANISGEPTPVTFKDISLEIREGVDFIVPPELQPSSEKAPSQIVKLGVDGGVKIIRD